MFRVMLGMTLTLALAGCNLTVETTAGGRVISTVLGIDCSNNQGSCELSDYETLLADDPGNSFLSAFAEPGYQFTGWEGNCSRTQYNDCFVDLNNDVYIKARFAPVTAAATPAAEHSVRFVALGDFGEGNTTQRFVSEAMESVCKQAGGCQFAVGLGDNLYDDNPTSTYSPAFEVKFELPYDNLEFPFFMSLGNHDNDLVFDGLGSFNHAGDIQVAYTYRDDKLSEKWQMPQRYYAFTAPQQSSNPLAQFIVLDSNPMIAPLEVAPAFAVEKYKTLQAEWLAAELAKPINGWRIAYTHHPFISNGVHGNAGLYDGVPALDPLTKRVAGEIYRDWFQQNVCGKVDLYLAGHDHDLQFLNSVPECGKTLFIISGAGAKSRSFKNPQRNAAFWQQDNSAGFFMIELKGNTMKVQAYTVEQYSGEYQMAFEALLPRRA